ncbi:MAG: hypothetical protein JW727_03485 [Candidatus Aenigmarchaeota archaeon]|nr:hypothetical protein [Candidatus Aenigmarchaeota archaeon]
MQGWEPFDARSFDRPSASGRFSSEESRKLRYFQKSNKNILVKGECGKWKAVHVLSEFLGDLLNKHKGGQLKTRLSVDLDGKSPDEFIRKVEVLAGETKPKLSCKKGSILYQNSKAVHFEIEFFNDGTRLGKLEVIAFTESLEKQAGITNNDTQGEIDQKLSRLLEDSEVFEVFLRATKN